MRTKLATLGLIALSTLGLAQAQDLRVGPRASLIPNNGATLVGFTIDYKSKGGLRVPIAIDVGDLVQKYTVGLGFEMSTALEEVHFALGAALSNINFSPNFTESFQSRVNRFTALLQAELTYQITNRLGLAVHMDVDLLNMSQTGAQEVYRSYAKDRGYSGMHDRSHYFGFDEEGRKFYYSNHIIGHTWYPEFDSKQDWVESRDRDLKPYKEQSATNYGISIKVKL